MTDAEFIDQVRRGLLMIMSALVRRYGTAWLDFLPRHVVVPAPVIYPPPTVTPPPEYVR